MTLAVPHPPSLKGLTMNQLNVRGPGRRDYRFERQHARKPAAHHHIVYQLLALLRLGAGDDSPEYKQATDLAYRTRTTNDAVSLAAVVNQLLALLRGGSGDDSPEYKQAVELVHRAGIKCDTVSHLPSDKLPANVAMLVLVEHFKRLADSPAALNALDRVATTIRALPDGQRLLELLALAAALETERNQALDALQRERRAHTTALADTRADRDNALANLDLARAAIMHAAGPPPDEDPREHAASHDHLTMLYLRQWYKALTADEQAAQPPLIKDLVKPWHKRGTAWIHVTTRAHKVGLTPYELTPPKNVARGQGAIQPVDFSKSHQSDPPPAA